MLHILLTILKVIGIILLVILALILALILIVLFVPLRYRVRVRKEDGPLEGDALFSWLLKLLRVEVRYRDKQGTAEIKVLWFRIKTIRIPEGHADDKKSIGKQTAVSAVSEKQTDRKPDEKPAEQPDQTIVQSEASVPESGDGKADKIRISQDTIRVQEHSPKTTVEKDGSEEPEDKKESKIHIFLGALPEKAVSMTEKVCDLLLKLIDLPFEIYDKADNAIDRTEKKIDAISKKIRPFLSVEAEHMLCKLIGYLKYLIRGWKPRKIEGYLEFGTGEPDMTGKLTGLIYLLLPDRAEHFDLRPDFYEKRFRANLTVSGRIRLYRAAVVLIRLVLDREFWALIRMIRNKPPKRKKERRKRRAAAVS